MKLHSSGLIRVLLLAMVLLLATVLLPAPRAMAGGCRGVPPRSFGDFELPGAQLVGVRTVTYVDASRPTAPNGSFPGAPERTLVTEIWYPALEAARDAPLDSAGGPYPVVLHSHGGGDSRTGGSLIGEQLASRGIIVAAPDYPLTSLNAPGGTKLDDLGNQPADWSFVLDSVLAEFGVDADPARVGATGHSFGAITTLLVTWHRDLRDPRIRAALPMAPASCFLTRRFYNGVQVPLLVMGGDSDQIFPFRQQSRAAFSRAAAPRFLVRLDEGSHNGFSPFATLFDPAEHYDRAGCDTAGDGPDLNAIFAALGGADEGVEVKPRRCPAPCAKPIPNKPSMVAGRHHQLLRVVQAAFFQAYLMGDDGARCFLRRTLRKEPDVKVRSAGAGRPAPLPAP